MAKKEVKYRLNRTEYKRLQKRYGFKQIQVARECKVSHTTILNRVRGNFFVKEKDAWNMHTAILKITGSPLIDFDKLFYRASRLSQEQRKAPKAKAKPRFPAQRCKGCILAKSERDEVVSGLTKAKETIVLALAGGRGPLDRKALKAADSISLAIEDVEKIKTS